MANQVIPAGFPLQQVPLVDAQGRLTRDWLYFIQALFNRTGGPSGVFGQSSSQNGAVPVFFDSSDSDSDSAVIPGPAGPAGAAGPMGPAIYPETVDVDEPMIVPPLFSPLGLFDELGSGGTPGFAAGVDFTAGTTTTLTLSRNYLSAANLFITFDASWQGADQFSLSGRTLTFTSAIPVGISKVFVKGFLQGK